MAARAAHPRLHMAKPACCYPDDVACAAAIGRQTSIAGQCSTVYDSYSHGNAMQPNLRCAGKHGLHPHQQAVLISELEQVVNLRETSINKHDRASDIAHDLSIG